jgi:hypothetical protein
MLRSSRIHQLHLDPAALSPALRARSKGIPRPWQSGAKDPPRPPQSDGRVYIRAEGEGEVVEADAEAGEGENPEAEEGAGAAAGTAAAAGLEAKE